MDSTQDVDLLIVGAGLRGLRAALTNRREHPTANLALVEEQPQPGGTFRTQRSNGFACELGPFAVTRDEVDPLLALLPQPPPLIGIQPSARQGWLWNGTERTAVAVDPEPWSFRSGIEEVVQHARRELGTALRLGRAVTATRPTPTGWEVELGGEVPSILRTRELHFCTPVATTSRLLAPLDPALGHVAERLESEPRAFAFFGGYQQDLPELTGYGMVPTDDLTSPVQEVIFCAQVFPGRALPGQALIRVELAGALLAEQDTAVLAAAEQELRRWTGCRGRLGFTKLHRFTTEVVDGAHIECRTRLRGLCARAPGLRM
ncbi:MAG: NAD(P)-binding protein [Planctomycetes bacterium]|nr:NAD(P)-binding protein [Planctomycetota bacterium]